MGSGSIHPDNMTKYRYLRVANYYIWFSESIQNFIKSTFWCVYTSGWVRFCCDRVYREPWIYGWMDMSTDSNELTHCFLETDPVAPSAWYCSKTDPHWMSKMRTQADSHTAWTTNWGHVYICWGVLTSAYANSRGACESILYIATTVYSANIEWILEHKGDPFTEPTYGGQNKHRSEYLSCLVTFSCGSMKKISPNTLSANTHRRVQKRCCCGYKRDQENGDARHISAITTCNTEKTKDIKIGRKKTVYLGAKYSLLVRLCAGGPRNLRFSHWVKYVCMNLYGWVDGRMRAIASHCMHRNHYRRDCGQKKRAKKTNINIWIYQRITHTYYLQLLSSSISCWSPFRSLLSKYKWVQVCAGVEKSVQDSARVYSDSLVKKASNTAQYCWEHFNKNISSKARR